MIYKKTLANAALAFLSTVALADETCINGSCTVDNTYNFTNELKAPTQSASDNSTKVATTAFVQSQFGLLHTWSALQVFGNEIHFNYASGAILGNLYYDGNFRYYANGFGTQFAFDNTTGGVAIYAAPSNSGGAGALATPVLRFKMAADGTAFFTNTVTEPALILGTAGTAPTAGTLGEGIESSVPIGSAVAFTSTVSGNVTSVSLSAGNWLCYGNTVTAPAAGTTSTNLITAITTTSATLPTAPNGGSYTDNTFVIGAGVATATSAGQRVFRSASPITVYLVANVTFASSTMGMYGYLGCLRQP